MSSEPRPGAAAQPLAFAALPDVPRELAPASSSILLVDDDEDSLRALVAVLEPLGQRLVTVRSGEQALRALLREDFALILLDMRMPGLDGVQTAAYITGRGRTRHIPIIFLTAHGDDVEQLMHAYASGAVDYVAKPFDPELLRSKVSVFVQLQHERAERIREARARAQAEAVASTVTKLQSVSDAALRHLELDELLREIVERASAVFGVDAAGLLLGEDGAAQLTAITSADLKLPENGGLKRDELLEELWSGPPRRSEEGASRERLPAALAASGMRSLLTAGLTIGAQRLGVLFLGSREAARFSDEDATVLALSADRAAIAIEHARSYERERGLVEALQRRLLPERLPDAPGLGLAARYLPSERAAHVGGDWYDVIALPGERTGLAIGDVVGHGVGAATLMGELRAALRAYAVAEPRSPARALARLNSLVASTHGAMVATLLYAVLDADGTRVLYSSAGHPPPLIAGAEGEVRFLERAAAGPLGASDLACFEDFECELEPGGTMLFYTDGLVERREQPIDTGLEQLRAALERSPRELEALCTHVLSEAPSRAGIEDDVALLAVRRVAMHAGPLEIELPAEPESVPIARKRFRRWLSDVDGASEQEAFDITLALNEACTNTVQHAYGPDRGHTFRVRAEQRGESVLLEVADSGRWRPRRRSRGGRGLLIIEQLMDEVSVERSATGTTLRMRRERAEQQ